MIIDREKIISRTNLQEAKWLFDIKYDENGIITSKFSIKKILKNSLYYPSCGNDGRPIQFLAGLVYSFIYVDYGYTQQQLIEALNEEGCEGYHQLCSRNITETEITPTGWQAHYREQDKNDLTRLRHYIDTDFVNDTPFALWIIFERDTDKTDEHGPKRFSFFFCCADGVAAFQALYIVNKMTPRVLAIIQPGHGFGCNYTNFNDPQGLFAWTVLGRCGEMAENNLIPDYLMHGGMGLNYYESCWPEQYPHLEGYFQRENGNGLWRRNEL